MDTADFSVKYKLFTYIIAILNIEHSYMGMETGWRTLRWWDNKW
jgi:hypothetical protein